MAINGKYAKAAQLFNSIKDKVPAAAKALDQLTKGGVLELMSK